MAISTFGKYGLDKNHCQLPCTTFVVLQKQNKKVLLPLCQFHIVAPLSCPCDHPLILRQMFHKYFLFYFSLPSLIFKFFSHTHTCSILYTQYNNIIIFLPCLAIERFSLSGFSAIFLFL